ncbi:NUDIX hydrolase [Enterovirga aerilata]|uniref:NUDIX hydrolase n=1 Tax=Enterovirga aerilata TaxID=2730920 RepID=A0A849I348_9HYPH|nr:NUDIX hydrolase [Enterovirga sp. DB1703]NNM71771.1 NUDIX hydrolase [Enterovirga sp. DB1703]
MSEICRVAQVEARLVEHRWAWAERNRAAIAENWARRRERTPAIFNGRVLMVAGTERSGDRLRAEFFAVDYAELIGWIDAGQPDPSVANGFAMGALRTADGAFILGRMADHTANAGRLYFPCGTPDLADVTPSGEVDLAGSLVREIGEETGLGTAELAVEPGWTIVRAAGLLAFMRLVRIGLRAEEARARILVHLAADPKPELSDIRIVRALADLGDAPVPPVVPAFLRDAFGRDQR